MPQAGHWITSGSDQKHCCTSKSGMWPDEPVCPNAPEQPEPTAPGPGVDTLVLLCRTTTKSAKLTALEHSGARMFLCPGVRRAWCEGMSVSVLPGIYKPHSNMCVCVGGAGQEDCAFRHVPTCLHVCHGWQ